MLASIKNDIQNVCLVEGEEDATFICEFSKGSMPDININWIFFGNVLDECGSTEEDVTQDLESNGCYTNDTHSVLLLRNISSLATGSYAVHCILQQSISDDFKNDPSFQGNCVTSGGTLTIIEPRCKLILSVSSPVEFHQSVVPLLANGHCIVTKT